MSKDDRQPHHKAGREAPASAWSPSEPPRSSLTRETIVTAALELADEEGLDAVSMRGVAARLGVHATSLYWHVKTKDALVDLMIDATVQEQLLPDPLPTQCEQALTAIAQATYARLRRHPWLSTELGRRRALVGPNTLRHLEQCLAATIGNGLDEDDALNVIAAVDSYVVGFAVREIAGEEAARRSGTSDAQWLDEIGPRVDALLKTREFPYIASLDAQHFLSADNNSQERFQLGLQALLGSLTADRSKQPGTAGRI